MNECIAKLANQSGFDVDATGKFGNYSEMHRLKKFAELIVAECLNIALKSGSVPNKSEVAVAEADRIYHKIQEHFGVE